MYMLVFTVIRCTWVLVVLASKPVIQADISRAEQDLGQWSVYAYQINVLSAYKEPFFNYLFISYYKVISR